MHSITLLVEQIRTLRAAVKLAPPVQQRLIEADLVRLEAELETLRVEC